MSIQHIGKAPQALLSYIGACLFVLGVSGGGASAADAAKGSEMSTNSKVSHPYVGMWVTRDGYIRHELLADGRYDEARGSKKSAYQGRYKVTGNHIDYVDDTGFTADGDFREGVLYHAGMVLYREARP